MRLDTCTAVVTGAAAGIGRAITEDLLDRGAEVVAVDRSETALDALRAGLADNVAGRLHPLAIDVREGSSATRAADLARRVGPPFRVLVNNAGLEVPADIVDTDDDSLRTMFETNVLGAFRFARAAIRHFSAEGGGTLVNICSVTSLRGYAGTSGYSATKFALNGLTESLQEEVRDRGVRVIGIYPGAVATDLLRGVASEEYFAQALAPAEVAQVVSQAVEMPDDVVVEKVVIRPLVEPPYSAPLIEP